MGGRKWLGHEMRLQRRIEGEKCELADNHCLAKDNGLAIDYLSK